MDKVQIEKIEAILKVLDKAKFTELTILEQYENVRVINNFAAAVKELKLSLDNVIPKAEEPFKVTPIVTPKVTPKARTKKGK